MIFRHLHHLIVIVCLAALIALVLARFEDGEAVLEWRAPFRVIDGDSLAQSGDRLRLSGIDAPELSQTCDLNGTIWHCGRAAADLLERLVRTKGVVCHRLKADKYRRVLVSCRAPGLDVNAEMVLNGLALDYGAYEAEAAAAQAARRGLWESRFERPEDWRKARRAELASEDDMPSTGFIGWLGSLIGY